MNSFTLNKVLEEFNSKDFIHGEIAGNISAGITKKEVYICCRQLVNDGFLQEIPEFVNGTRVDGRKWVITYNGIQCLNNGGYQKYVKSKNIKAFFEKVKNYIIILTFVGLIINVIFTYKNYVRKDEAKLKDKEHINLKEEVLPKMNKQ